MRARLGIIGGILLIGFGWLGSAGAEEPKVEKAAPKTILFLGDSITRAGGYVRIIEAELAKQIPLNSWRVVNHGRNSETVSDLSEAYHPGRRPCVLVRLDEELKQNKPDWVVACYGINCGIYHPFSEKRFAAYQAGVETFIKKVHASGARVILLTAPPYAFSGPFPAGSDEAVKEAIVAKADVEAEAEAAKNPNKFGYRTPYPYYDYVMARYAKWLLTLNGRKDVWVVDLRGAMLPKVKEAHGGDPIHPNGFGHSLMAEAFLKQWPIIQAQFQGSFTIRDGTRTVLEYRTTASPMKPYVRELSTPGGVQVLRDSPADHKHHHGLMFALGVDGVDFWGEEAGAGTEKPRSSLNMTVSFLDASCTKLIQTLDWSDTHGKKLLVERREVGVVAEMPLPVTLVVWNTELSTAEGVAAVKLDGHHYYGLGMRFLKSMDSGGRFFNSAEQPGEVVGGSERLVAAKWCAYTAKADGKQVTVAIFDHPTNPRHPNKLFTMTPPFAYLSATLNLWKEPLVLKAGAKLKLSYAVAAWDGETPAEQVESLYEKWSNAK